MAKRYGGDEQALQQFINQSPWDWMVIRREVAVRMARDAGPRGAWVLDDTGFPKKGEHSVGVARQYSGIPGTRYLFLLWLPLWGAFLQRTADDSFGSCEERPIATRPPCPGVSAKHLDVLRVTGKEAMPVIDAGQGAWIVNKRVRSGHAEVRLCSRPGLVFWSFYRQNLNASPFEKGASL